MFYYYLNVAKSDYLNFPLKCKNFTLKIIVIMIVMMKILKNEI